MVFIHQTPYVYLISSPEQFCQLSVVSAVGGQLSQERGMLNVYFPNPTIQLRLCAEKADSINNLNKWLKFLIRVDIPLTRSAQMDIFM